MNKSYNPKIVTAFFAEQGISEPQFELQFHPLRRWKFDLSWPGYMLAIEVQGGIWSRGRHNRGAAMLKEWEKLNEAATMGWRILYCQPSSLCMVDFAKTIKKALNF